MQGQGGQSQTQRIVEERKEGEIVRLRARLLTAASERRQAIEDAVRAALADSERKRLQGVIELERARKDTAVALGRLKAAEKKAEEEKRLWETELEKKQQEVDELRAQLREAEITARSHQEKAKKAEGDLANALEQVEEMEAQAQRVLEAKEKAAATEATARDALAEVHDFIAAFGQGGDQSAAAVIAQAARRGLAHTDRQRDLARDAGHICQALRRLGFANFELDFQDRMDYAEQIKYLNSAHDRQQAQIQRLRREAQGQQQQGAQQQGAQQQGAQQQGAQQQGAQQQGAQQQGAQQQGAQQQGAQQQAAQQQGAQQQAAQQDAAQQEAAQQHAEAAAELRRQLTDAERRAAESAKLRRSLDELRGKAGQLEVDLAGARAAIESNAALLNAAEQARKAADEAREAAEMARKKARDEANAAAATIGDLEGRLASVRKDLAPAAAGDPGAQGAPAAAAAPPETAELRSAESAAAAECRIQLEREQKANAQLQLELKRAKAEVGRTPQAAQLELARLAQLREELKQHFPDGVGDDGMLQLLLDRELEIAVLQDKVAELEAVAGSRAGSADGQQQPGAAARVTPPPVDVPRSAAPAAAAAAPAGAGGPDGALTDAGQSEDALSGGEEDGTGVPAAKRPRGSTPG